MSGNNKALHKRGHSVEQRKQTNKSTERRRYSRYPSDHGVQCWEIPGMSSIWGKLQDLSPDGCFIETAAPFPTGSQVRLLIRLFGWQVRAEGQVRVSDSRRGMGVMFTVIKSEDADNLRAALARMGASEKPLTPNSETLIQTIENWFQTYDSLPRATFQQMRDTGND